MGLLRLFCLHKYGILPFNHSKILSPTSVLSSKIRLYSWKNFTLDEDLTLEIKQSIEKKWHKKVYGLECLAERKKINKPDKEPAKYILSMFPYPSGRLHLGHVRVYTLSDVLARFYRLQGYNVVHPMGWDAFGLPAENAARENGVDAEIWTRDNISFMKNQIIDMGCCFDWEREFATCDPEYYKWTQWIFNKLFEKGLAYKKRAYVFWDPVDETVLAEEQVDSENRSWRSGAKVEKKLLQQWFVRTTVFAEKLSSGLKSGQLNHGWRDVVHLQDHWIGQIKGYSTDIVIEIKEFLSSLDLSECSTEPIRLWFSDENSLKNATYFILRPDHFLSQNDKCVLRTFSNGIKLMNFKISNPVTGHSLPVFSGTNEVLPCVPTSSDCRTDEILGELEYEDLSKNESFLQEITEINKNIKDNIPDKTIKKPFVFYPASLKLRDWLVSRQRKWGTPIPAVSCLDCGETSAVTCSELPVTDPSSNYSEKCSNCGSANLKRETDTLDTFFDSSWYFFRFLDSMNQKEIFDINKVNKLLPVHTYIGGKEHATLHLYYARFMTHFLHSLGLSPVTEPFQKLIPIGAVMGESFMAKESGKYLSSDLCEIDGKNIKCRETGKAITTKWEKMSKSKHNGIDPEIVIQNYGIDTTRLLSMCEAAPTSARKWPPNNVGAFLKCQDRLWLLLREFVDAKDFGDIVFFDDETWQKAESEIFDARNFHLKGITHNFTNTSQISVAISKIQGLLGALRKIPKAHLKESLEFERALGTLIIVLYPLMPAFSAQLWQSFRDVATATEPEFDLDNEVWEQRWPSVDWRYQLDLICKLKGEEIVAKVERNYLDTLDQETALQIALDQPGIQKLLTTSKCEIIRFVVEPEFRATLTIRELKPHNPSPSNDDLDGSSEKQINSKENLKV